MDIFQECVGGPPPMFLNCDGIHSIELHCHSTTSTKGVAANILSGEAILLESKVDDCVLECCVDM